MRVPVHRAVTEGASASGSAASGPAKVLVGRGGQLAEPNGTAVVVAALLAGRELDRQCSVVG